MSNCENHLPISRTRFRETSIILIVGSMKAVHHIICRFFPPFPYQPLSSLSQLKRRAFFILKMTNRKKKSKQSCATHTLRQSINWKYPNRPYPSVIVILSVKKRKVYVILYTKQCCWRCWLFVVFNLV